MKRNRKNNSLKLLMKIKSQLVGVLQVKNRARSLPVRVVSE
jgi:hypothetical protein